MEPAERSDMQMEGLSRVRRKTAQRVRAEQAWREAIRQAHQEGHSMRAIAEAAHLSPTRVHQIIAQKEEKP